MYRPRSGTKVPGLRGFHRSFGAAQRAPRAHRQKLHVLNAIGHRGVVPAGKGALFAGLGRGAWPTHLHSNQFDGILRIGPWAVQRPLNLREDLRFALLSRKIHST
eukprot:Skav207914  [mRNA]  locus=scaffold190:311784:323801:+ [translate_table: standard]